MDNVSAFGIATCLTIMSELIIKEILKKKDIKAAKAIEKYGLALADLFLILEIICLFIHSFI